MIQIGVIGCGSITKFRHGPEYTKNPNSNIKAFCDPILERAEEMSSQFGGIVYKSYKDIIADPEVDAVSICTANETHAQITIEALRAGKHVLCEKPMALNIEQAKEMLQVAKHSGCFLMIGHNQRLIPAHKKAKEIIKRGDVGEVITFRTSFKHGGPETWSADKNSNTWFFNRKSAAFGVLGDLGIHKLDLIQWFLDDKIHEVNATVSTLHKRDNQNKLIEVEDNAFCVLKTLKGTIGTMEVSWTNYGMEDNSTILYCEKGVLKICNNPDYDIVVEMNNGENIYYKSGGISTNTNQMNSGVIDVFIQCILENKAPLISGEEGYKALAAVEACIRSSKESTWVKVENL